MKKAILTFAVVVSLMAMSFTTNDKKSNYKEVSLNPKVVKDIAGKFTRYERDHYTPGKGEWNYRSEVWELTNDSGSTSELQSTLSKY